MARAAAIRRTMLRALMLWLIACAVCPAAPVWAADRSKIAATIATAAGNAYAGGEFARAAELYLNAFKTDPNPAYLFGAARAEHVAGQNEVAAEHYRQFLALNPADAARVAKAREYLTEIDSARAAAQVLDGDKEARAGNHHMAGQIYYDAWKRAHRSVYLFKAACAEQSAGETANAIAYLREYLDKAEPDAADRNQAKARLDALTAPAKPPVPEPPPQKVPDTAPPPKFEAPPVVIKPPVAKPEIVVAKPVVPVPPPPSSAGPNWLGWGTLGAGVVLLGVGAGLAFSQLGELASYNQVITPDSDGLIRSIAESDAKTRASAINTKIGTGVGLAVVGLGAGVTGAILLLRKPDAHAAADSGKVTVTGWLAPTSVGLSGRF